MTASRAQCRIGPSFAIQFKVRERGAIAVEIWLFFRTWGSVLGLSLDIVGAVLVYYGIRINIARADALEQVVVPVMMDDLGSRENIKQNQDLSHGRALERLRASRWAAAGLALFVLGFALQAISSWPKG